MSTHQKQDAISFTGAEVVDFALAELPPFFTLLPAGTEARFVPVNTDANWGCGALKRTLDLIVAVPALLLLAPLFAAIALLIRLDSRGPALFRQKRNGICGRPFGILKFRTMNVLEDGETIVQARESDPRVTRVGRWLRRYSLDELPQLINVIAGDMSLVGPRPHAQAHDSHYGAMIRQYRHRQAVKPGMTGWAQVNGHRGPTPTVELMARRIDLDLWYARHASLALDVEILLRTPLEVFRHRNAC
ncbi:MAG TPA: exopolysaccharide biosynthesis polyprenyl glycosylphosphotransferase [Rhizomicrobium sp.]|nr:exopolysaccharide biosynthesis polyprenyl glycosylphosphotransferase [Rhizomicrobium sp.]